MVDFNVSKLPPVGASGRAVASAVNLLIDGKNNAKGVFTLTASAATTVVSDFCLYRYRIMYEIFTYSKRFH